MSRLWYWWHKYVGIPLATRRWRKAVDYVESAGYYVVSDHAYQSGVDAGLFIPYPEHLTKHEQGGSSGAATE